MSNPRKRSNTHPWKKQPTPVPQTVPSLLDAMEDGREYGSIVSLTPKPNYDVIDEAIRAITDIASIRHRPCIAYVGNVLSPDDGTAGIDSSDDLPFHEMVNKVPAGAPSVDVLLATMGGSNQQVSRFVNALRGRFEEVDFLLPSFCMSAGTMFALSGDNVWMTSRACLGPIDPQVPSKDGRLVPAQALMMLISQLQIEGAEAMQKGAPVPWTAVRIIDSLDKKDLADAFSASNYSITMVAEFLETYKFKKWTEHAKTKVPVTPEERAQVARNIAVALASHDRWKSHGHAITRELLQKEVGLRIDYPENVPSLDRALARFWALCNWIFARTTASKLLLSSECRYVRHKEKER